VFLIKKNPHPITSESKPVFTTPKKKSQILPRYRSKNIIASRITSLQKRLLLYKKQKKLKAKAKTKEQYVDNVGFCYTGFIFV
jgi:hypothetical protein